jgi:hypothetical protein
VSSTRIPVSIETITADQDVLDRLVLTNRQGVFYSLQVMHSFQQELLLRTAQHSIHSSEMAAEVIEGKEIGLKNESLRLVFQC